MYDEIKKQTAKKILKHMFNIVKFLFKGILNIFCWIADICRTIAELVYIGIAVAILFGLALSKDAAFIAVCIWVVAWFFENVKWEWEFKQKAKKCNFPIVGEVKCNKGVGHEGECRNLQ